MPLRHPMESMDELCHRAPALSEAKTAGAGAGAALLFCWASRRRSPLGVARAYAARSLYRGLPFLALCRTALTTTLRTRSAASVRKCSGIYRLEVPLADVYRFWRRLDNLPQFMKHLDRVTETSDGKSHWVTSGPAGLAVEWDAEIINEVENQLVAWRSLPGSDVVTAGSVSFDSVRGGRSTSQRASAVRAACREGCTLLCLSLRSEPSKRP